MPNSFMAAIYSGYSAKEKGNHKEAFDHFQKALELEKDSPIAAYEVGLYYEEGVIVPQDMEKAYKLFTQAAYGWVEKAQMKLADWYDQGIHLEKNAETARLWRERATVQQKKDDEPPLTLAESIRRKIAESQAQNRKPSKD